MPVNTDIDQFDDVGYVVLPDLLSSEEADELYGAFEDLPPAPRHGPIAKHNERTLLRDGRFFDAITKSELLEAVREIVGDDLQLLALDALETAPHSGRDRNWHADMAFWSDALLTANVAIYLQDMTGDAGPLLVIPGSHRWRRTPEPDEEHAQVDGEVAVRVRRGTAVVFNAQLWHSGGRNDSDRPRRALFPYFGHYWIKRMDEFYRRPLPDYVVNHQDPLVRQLFGLGLTTESVHGVYDETTYG
jgi:ectoine hydroxylase-related dioxygenase (phytanoyl-CoA dioxygenase family)